MLDQQDPRLTAFVLGELPESEQAEISTLVAESPELASEVAAIRQFSARLTSMLSREGFPALQPAEREQILQAAQQSVAPASTQRAQSELAQVEIVGQQRWYRRRMKLLGSLAALLLVGVTLLLLLPQSPFYWNQPPLYRATVWLRVEDVGNFDPTELGPERSIPSFEYETAPGFPTHRPIGDLHSRIPAKEVEQELLKAQFEALETQRPDEVQIDEDEVRAEAANNPEVRRMQQEALAQRKTLEPVLNHSGKHPVDPHLHELLQANLKLERQKNELIQSVSQKIRARKRQEAEQKRQATLLAMEKRIASNQLEIDFLRDRFFVQRDELIRKAPAKMPLAFKQVEFDREVQILEMIAFRIKRLRAEYKAPARVQIVRKAEPPAVALQKEGVFGFGWFIKGSGDSPTDTNEKTQSELFREQQIRLLHSPLVLERVLARPEIAKSPDIAANPSPVHWLSSHLNVTQPSDPKTLILEFVSPDRQLSADVANAVAEEYVRVSSPDDNVRTPRVIELLEDELSRRMVLVQQMQEQMHELKARTVGSPREND